MTDDFFTRDRLYGKPTVYIMVGLPRSGKSTWVNRNRYRLDANIVSSDDIRRALGIDRQDPRRESFVDMVFRLAVLASITRGQHTIVDDTNHTTALRRRWVALIGRKAKIVYVTIPQPEEDEWKRRCRRTNFPWAVVEMKRQQYEPVSSREGRGRIIVNTTSP